MMFGAVGEGELRLIRRIQSTESLNRHAARYKTAVG